MIGTLVKRICLCADQEPRPPLAFKKPETQ